MKKLMVMTLMVVFGMAAIAQEASTGNKIPSVTIKNIDGNSFDTKDITNDGKPIIISFWALWCKPCKLEMDAYNENYADWVEETGVKIYAVSIDDARSTAKVLPFVSGKGWTMEMLLDPNSDFKRALNFQNVPQTFILDGKGNIVWQHTSFAEGGEYEIIKLLRKVANGEDISDQH